MSDSLIVQFVGYEVHPWFASTRLPCARTKRSPRIYADHRNCRVRWPARPVSGRAGYLFPQAAPGTRRRRQSSGEYALPDYRPRAGRLPRPALAQTLPKSLQEKSKRRVLIRRISGLVARLHLGPVRGRGAQAGPTRHFRAGFYREWRPVKRSSKEEREAWRGAVVSRNLSRARASRWFMSSSSAQT